MSARRSRQRRPGLRAGFWQAFAAPGLLWLCVLFVVPFWAVMAIAMGGRDPIFFGPLPEWNPLQWQFDNFSEVADRLFGSDPSLRVVFLRTFSYVAIATLLCVVIGYPVAYYLARARGRVRSVLLVLVVAPFWISYLMRMLAWQNILLDDGYLNRLLTSVGLLEEPYPWLGGKTITVVLGLVYGYVPLFILPLFASLDRIDQSLIEVARDSGASSTSTLVRVILPLSKQGLLAGTVLITLPMFGDYYTTDLLSGRPATSMIGNQITFYLTQGQGTQQGLGAALVLTLSAVVSVLMVYYLVSVARASRELR
jgi:spermidine/putrescine transport system permease protein